MFTAINGSGQKSKLIPVQIKPSVQRVERNSPHPSRRECDRRDVIQLGARGSSGCLEPRPPHVQAELPNI
ncbi:hypothetical protein RRG08_054905 [Elysia crispata]|uniref:Uncharacterized protein n=1 Tax=Elysia crispata TaxID=231223 RepID=A0AAE1A6J2_9GAST|nr:hypothetical protein RRG08_054905 [Elysia crispata]